MRFTGRLDKLEELTERLRHRRPLVLTYPLGIEQPVPREGDRISGDLGAYVFTLEEDVRHAVVERLTDDPSPRVTSDLVVLHLRESVAHLALGLATGAYDEAIGYGARGDGKTHAGAATWAIVSLIHAREGFPLPYRIACATDTHAAHVKKLCRSLIDPIWGGLWSMRDGSKEAVLTVDGVELLVMDLLGVADPSANAVRAEWHGAWIEEPAPAALESASGVGLAEFMILGSSLRLPSYAHPVLLTSNYPDRDHWTAVRFLDEGEPRRLCVRIPPGERAPVEYRERQATLLAARPDLKARLIDGEFGTVVQGAQVAVGFKKDLHVARHPLSPQHGGGLVIGWDGGFQPSAIVGQRMGDEIHVFASLTKGGVGTLQCIEDVVGPWLREHAPWSLRSSPGDRRLIHAIDPSMKTGSQADRTVSPESVIRKKLGGHIVYGAVSWPGRRDPMLTLLGQATLDGGLPRAKLQLDAEGCGPLIQALDHAWYYPVNPATGQVSREGPKKPNSPAADLGDAFAYFCGAVTSGRDPAERARLHQFYTENPPRARTAHDTLDYQVERRGDVRTVTGKSPWGDDE